MACVCDVAIAVDDAKFGLTETKLGIIIGSTLSALVGLLALLYAAKKHPAPADTQPDYGQDNTEKAPA